MEGFEEELCEENNADDQVPAAVPDDSSAVLGAKKCKDLGIHLAVQRGIYFRSKR